jgi:hypothetical protein
MRSAPAQRSMLPGSRIFGQQRRKSAPMTRIESKHQWVDLLAGLNPIIGSLNLKKGADVLYVETVDSVPVFHDSDAYNLSNSDPHNQMIARVATVLHASLGDGPLRHALGELMYRKTYGAFCELAVYDWMARGGISVKPQIAMLPADVINPNGATLDGRMTFPNGRDVYFDSKAFGFQDRLVNALKDRLTAEFPGEVVTIGGNFDLPIETVQDLLDYRGFKPLAQDLGTHRFTKRDTLEFTLHNPAPMIVTHATKSARGLARANEDYLFRYAGQFARNAPFMLFLAIHPWFSGLDLQVNFSGYVDTLTQEFVTPLFNNKRNDPTLRDGVPTGDIVKLLSGVVFLDVWPKGITKNIAPSARILLNPGATHRLRKQDFAFLEDSLSDEIRVEEISAGASSSHRFVSVLLPLLAGAIAAAGIWWLAKME